MSISKSDIQRCLLLLEPHASHSATLAIHDPLYALLSDDSDARIAELTMAINDQFNHPAVPELLHILTGHVSVTAPDMRGALAKFAPLETPDDLVGEVGRRLERNAAERRILNGRIDELESALRASNRSSNAVATIGAFALLFSLFGWAIAFGWLEVDWLTSPRGPDVERHQGVR